MSNSFVLSFKKNISLIEQSSDRVVVQSPLIPLNRPEIAIELNQLSPGLLTAIRRLAGEGGTEEDLIGLVQQTDDFLELPKFYYYLEKFLNLGLLCHSVLEEGVPLVTRIPISPSKSFQIRNIAVDQSYVLSRFAYCRKHNEQLVLESPLSHAQIVLAGWKGAALIAELAQPQAARELCTKIPGVSEKTVQLFFSLLLSSEMLCEVKEDGKIPEVESETFVQWEFHDLLFHSRSRTGRHDNPVGRTYPFFGKIEPLPAIKPKVSNETINLYKPDIEDLKLADSTLTLVLEERKSIRCHNDDEPITDKQLGEFLYRTARVKEIIQTEREEISTRPYVSAGPAHEFELYITVNVCQNIPSGLYHYDPKDHQLCRISGRNSQVEALLEEARMANRESCMPQVLIIISARFQRMAWIGETITYATILKNVGVLYKTMYLVATAMNLAPCGLAEGNSDLFAAAVGTDYYAESSVGEFLLGSRPGA